MPGKYAFLDINRTSGSNQFNSLTIADITSSMTFTTRREVGNYHGPIVIMNMGSLSYTTIGWSNVSSYANGIGIHFYRADYTESGIAVSPSTSGSASIPASTAYIFVSSSDTCSVTLS